MKKAKFAFILIGIGLLVILVNDYSFSPEGAAKSTSLLTKDFELVDQSEMGSASVLLFKSDKQKEYRTFLVEKSGLLYRSGFSTFGPYSSDPLRLVGGMSVTTENIALTYMSILSMDKEISYIEAGLEPNVKRIEISKGERISFLFPFSEQLENLNPAAYDKNGKKLYYFGYPKDTNVFSSENFKWHKIN